MELHYTQIFHRQKKKYKENAEKSINFPMKKINAVDTFNYNTYNIVSIISMKIFKIAIYK